MVQGADRAALRGAAGQLGLTIQALEERLSAAGTSFKSELRMDPLPQLKGPSVALAHTTSAKSTRVGHPGTREED